MKNNLKLHNFEGPLDLLLQLIEAEELSITNIALADVTEQFLQYLQEVEERHPDELADFLVVATKLLLLKSQALLPYLQWEEEEDPKELEAQLKMYKQYADAAERLQTMLAEKNFLYSREPSWQTLPIVFTPPQGVTTEILHATFAEVLHALEPIVRLPKAVMANVMSLREKLCQLQEMLTKNIRTHFHDLIIGAQDRHDVVLTFLALLELVKQQAVCVKQHEPFGDIEIEKI